MKNTCKNFKSKMFWYAVIFLSPREGKFKQKNNQLFSWLKKEGKTEASASLIDWPVGPVSASQNAKFLESVDRFEFRGLWPEIWAIE